MNADVTPPSRAQSSRLGGGQLSLYALVGLLVFHAVLARVEKGRPLLVMLYGVATLGAALAYATDPRRPERTVQAVAYICGAEVLWHMGARSGALPWEFGKYAIVLVMLVALQRRGRGSWLPVSYFALLLPSAALTLSQMGPFSAREAISASLSGPFAITVSLAFMTGVRLTPRHVCAALLSFVVPIAGVAFLCYGGTFGAAEVNFGNGSSKAASGGFAPNQVSAVLGFGVICALFWCFFEKGRLPFKALFLVLSLWFGVQCGLTFSRTGVYLVALCVGVAVLPLLRSARARWTFASMALTVYIAAHFVLLPLLDHFTGGALQERFENQGLTHRDVLMAQQLEVWMSHPVLGVGAGVIDSANSVLDYRAHTEYTRLVAEHGILGLAALVILLICLFRAFKLADTPEAKALFLAMTVFGLAFMVVSATRLALLAFAFGLASVRLVPDHQRCREPAPQPSRAPQPRPRRPLPSPPRPCGFPTLPPGIRCE